MHTHVNRMQRPDDAYFPTSEFEFPNRGVEGEGGQRHPEVPVNSSEPVRDPMTTGIILESYAPGDAECDTAQTRPAASVVAAAAASVPLVGAGCADAGLGPHGVKPSAKK